MNSLAELARAYLSAQKGVWAETTLRSETARLNAVLPLVEGRSVEEAWRALAEMAPYARVTAWVRLSAMITWARDAGLWSGSNAYQLFRDKNRGLFQSAYKRQPARFSYDELLAKLELVGDPTVRDAAFTILKNGLRWCELQTLKDGRVTGKGGYEREILYPKHLEHDVSYTQLWRGLRKVGVKPHDLRKVFAQKLVELGCNDHDLLKVMGWRSYETAKSYVAARKTDEVRQMVEAGELKKKKIA